jgi:hypothetical protein
MLLNLLVLQVAGPVIAWGEVGAAVLNVVIALVLTQVVKWGFPIIRDKYPWALPIISMSAPFLFAKAAEFLLGVLGYPVDFGPVLDLIVAGGFAVAVNQTWKQTSRGK